LEAGVGREELVLMIWDRGKKGSKLLAVRAVWMRRVGEEETMEMLYLFWLVRWVRRVWMFGLGRGWKLRRVVMRFDSRVV